MPVWMVKLILLAVFVPVLIVSLGVLVIGAWWLEFLYKQEAEQNGEA